MSPSMPPSATRRGRTISAIARLAIAGVLVAGSIAWLAPSAGAQGEIIVRGQLGGQPLDLSSSGDPIILNPDRSTILSLDMVNPGSEPVVVRHVQIRGTAFGITLMAYDFTINAVVGAGQRERLEVPVEFVDLDEQFNGLLPATMRLLNVDESEVAAQDFVVDIKGSPGSLVVIFTVIVAIATGISIASIWIAIVRRRLPPNRIRRGIRLGIAGAGVGVTLTLLLSVLLFMPPKGSVWIPLLLIPTLTAFVLGYLSPGPMAMGEAEEEEVEEWMRATVPMQPAG
jgi:hypothetical protein